MSDWTREYIKTHPIKALATIKGLGVVSDVQSARIAEQDAEIARLREATRAIISDQTTPDSDGDVMVNGELINALANAMQPAKEDS
jgi:hypothetical protein